MAFTFKHLNRRIRVLMTEEVQLDEERGELFSGKFTNEAGKAAFPGLLRSAILTGDEVSLAQSLHSDFFLQSYAKRKPQGGSTYASVPRDANQNLAEGEFNRFYIRAVCRLALEMGCLDVEIYRARHAENPRPESQMRIGKLISAQSLLNDLRNSQGVDTALGCPTGPRSGLSVMLPAAFAERSAGQQEPALA